MHADHVLDLVPFAYALLFARGGRPFPPLPLHVPPGAADRLHRLSGIWGDDGLITTAFAVREYDPGATLRLGRRRRALRARARTTSRAWAVSLGGRIVFGADCAPNDAVVQLARGAGVLMLEATLAAPESTAPFGHLTPAQAGELGPARGRPAPRRHARPGDLRRGVGAGGGGARLRRARSRSPREGAAFEA